MKYEFKTLNMNFGDAFEQVKTGKAMRLPAWKEDVKIKAQYPIGIETIAEAVHNAWWEEKKKQGVSNHPDMIPYDKLADNVKEYDRVTAIEVLKTINNMTAPYLYVESRFGKVPWKETMIELFSNEWEVID